MEIVSRLESQGIAWLLGLEHDAVTCGADPKAEYEVWSVIED